MPLVDMSFKVIKAGFLACIQDQGRLGHAQHGMSYCGAIDEHAYHWANYLLDNVFNAATLEITFGGVTLKALNETAIIVTGADLGFKINGKLAPTWRTLQINSADLLSWDTPKSGVRAYLAVKGGFNTKVLFDSQSINLRENIGAKIATDKVLPCQKFVQTHERFMQLKYLPDYSQDITLRLLPSYQFKLFNDKQQHLFFHQTYTISNANDRTGCRLNGIPINIKQTKMISEGMSYGSVEITTDGLPIVLLKDAPTIGGYPKIGTVFSLDLAKLAQKQAGTKIKFARIDVLEAQQQRLAFNRFFQMIVH